MFKTDTAIMLSQAINTYLTTVPHECGKMYLWILKYSKTAVENEEN